MQVHPRSLPRMTIYIPFLILTLKISLMVRCLPSHSFKAVVQQPFFVDKTEMLRVLFEQNTTATGQPHYYYITAPRRFGKGTNLDMVHEFAAIELDDIGEAKPARDATANDIFNKLNIAKHPHIISEHFAKYPIIHLDMMGIAHPETTVEQMVLDLNVVLWYELQQYPQLKKLIEYPNQFGLGEHEMIFLRNLQNKTLDVGALENSLLNFARILYLVYQQPVVLLLHEYDETAFVSYITIKSYATPIYRHLNEMVTRALTFGKSYIKIAIINALTTLPYSLDHSLQAATTHYAFLDEHPFAAFYGLTEPEVNSLFHRYGCNETERQSVLAKYRGYKTVQNQTTLFNSLSIAFYFKDRQDDINKPIEPKNYFKTCDYADRLSLFTRDDVFRNTIETLIKNGSITRKIEKDHDNVALRNLELLRDRRWVGTLTHHTDAFFTQCFEMGYLSHGPEEDVYVIPNRELKQSIEENVQTYYRLYAPLSTSATSSTNS